VPNATLEYFNRSLVVDPAYVDGYFQRALVYVQLQKLAECEADLRKVLELQPDGPKAETARKALAPLRSSAHRPAVRPCGMLAPSSR